MLAKLAAVALRSHHPELLVQALQIAIDHGPWPDPKRLQTIADVRNYLYWIGMKRQVHLAEPLLGDVTSKQNLGVHGIVSEPDFLDAYFGHSGDHVVYQLTDLVMQAGKLDHGTWTADIGEGRGAHRRVPPRATCWSQPSPGPVLAFELRTTNGGIAVERWNGEGWLALGSPRAPGRNAYEPAVALMPDGDPAVVYSAEAPGGGRAIYFEVWKVGRATLRSRSTATAESPSRGNIWSRTRSSAATSTFESAGTTGSDGAPMVFWNAGFHGDTSVAGKRWNGYEWADLAGSAKGLPGSERGGDPTAAVSSGGTWRPFGGGSTTCDGMAGLEFPVTVDSQNWPVVAFLEGTGDRWIRVQRIEGDRFVDLGPITCARARANYATISRDRDGIVVAWADGERVHVVRWDGATWVPLGVPTGAIGFTRPVIVSR